jgi:uncharacterized membrane protein
LFDEILGIPAHPLLVHAAVIFVPLQVAAAIAYGLLPWARRNIGWLVVSLAVVAPFTVWFAKLSGEALRTRLASKGVGDLSKIDQHSGYATNAWYLSMALGALMILLVVVRGRPVVDAHTGAPRSSGGPVLSIALTVLTVIAAGATGYYIFKTGDSGAHMVWQGV